MTKPVAVKADVSSTPSSTGATDFGAQSGAWTKAGALDVTAGAKVTVGGAPVALSASQGFGWTGANASGTALPPGSSTVTLTTGDTKLQVGGQSVLLDGDSKQDSYGNKISVSASGKLQTA